MNELINKLNVKDMIYEIRGKQVLLDSDLAKLYGTTTKRVNEAVKNNPDKFPVRYCFKLTKEEIDNISRSKFSTLNKKKRGYNIKYLPTVFTEQGVYMLATILKTKVAAETTIKIMDTFVEMRKFINNSKNVFSKISVIENLILEHDIKINELFNKFDNRINFKSKLFFNGEVYDAYSLLVDIIVKANDEIIIIDNYVDKTTLDILSKKKNNVAVLLIIGKNKSKLTKIDIDKFNKEYPNLKLKYTSDFHDRFIILDNKELYHLGASLKDLGNKVFGINKIEDEKYIKDLKERIDTCTN